MSKAMHNDKCKNMPKTTSVDMQTLVPTQHTSAQEVNPSTDNNDEGGHACTHAHSQHANTNANNHNPSMKCNQGNKCICI